MKKDEAPITVLILCTGNSSRSILAEVLFNDLGGERFLAHSAGSQPSGNVNPDALQKLADEGHRTDGLRSKSWDEFSGPGAPPVDIVITVCDSAAGESCPLWRGSPITVHWGIPDPARASTAEADAAFDLTYTQLRSRIEQVIELPLESLDRRHWKDAFQRIHEAAQMREAIPET
ncbi:MAG TPA: arsenate reductase ArsC [Woeseiaceae bacterium]|nr:arsenate reductase ArsC [Woeseiaceae bacterium]